MKTKYDVKIYSLTLQESINNTSAERNRQLRPSPRPKRTHHHHGLVEVAPRRSKEPSCKQHLINYYATQINKYTHKTTLSLLPLILFTVKYKFNE